jgi:hypothetical protein
MTTTDRCDEIVRMIDGALADCGGGSQRRHGASLRSCTDTPSRRRPAAAASEQRDETAEHRRQLLEAVDAFLASPVGN